MNTNRIAQTARGAARLAFLCTFALMAAAPQGARAAISCSISSPGWTTSYMTTATTATTGASTVSIDCTRATTDPSTQTYTLAANNGLQPKGQTNQAISGASLIKYNEYQNAALSLAWGSGGNRTFAGTINFGASTTASAIVTYYYGIPALQNVAAGVYTDTVTMTLTYGAATALNTHPVAVIVNPTCTLSSPPGALSFAYTSMQGAPAAASSSFAVTCTNMVPYTVSLDAYAVTDSAVNLSYTLNVGQTILPAGAAYTAGGPLSATGNGLAQTISIDGTMTAGQSGTCATATCTNAASANNVRTLTITY
jgi:spore coat protein U-like protein